MIICGDFALGRTRAGHQRIHYDEERNLVPPVERLPLKVIFQVFNARFTGPAR